MPRKQTKTLDVVALEKKIQLYAEEVARQGVFIDELSKENSELKEENEDIAEQNDKFKDENTKLVDLVILHMKNMDKVLDVTTRSSELCIKLLDRLDRLDP
jgi:hypothetical protein